MPRHICQNTLGNYFNEHLQGQRNGFQSGGSMEYWKVLSVTIVGRQEKSLNFDLDDNLLIVFTLKLFRFFLCFSFFQLWPVNSCFRKRYEVNIKYHIFVIVWEISNQISYFCDRMRSIQVQMLFWLQDIWKRRGSFCCAFVYCLSLLFCKKDVLRNFAKLICARVFLLIKLQA